MENLIDIVCADCGSPDVGRDAWVQWDTEKQDWSEVRSVFDDAKCFECGGSSLKEVPLLEEEKR